MEQRKCENADDTKQIEDHTKQNKRRQSSWDPNSVGLGLGYFERAKLSHSCWIELFVGQLRSLVNSVCWSSEVSIGTLEKIRFGDVDCGKLLHYKDTIHRRNKRPILRYFLTMMLM
ncbi:hypothetical protein T01_4058 [Trichinella spiralis]|uniref:Uncharacterized protein n=2 Tax=Trichinella spiralis TaxID=6334 RepID=A0A0V1C2I5_TRISP|nr:hypothetical protein T01_4058 [Trichinella spiralis]